MSPVAALLAQVVLVLLVALFVLAPLWFLRGERVGSEAAGANRRRSIDERKMRLYQALVELDFDRDSHKISEADHGRMREDLMSEVVRVLAEEEGLGLAGSPERPKVIVGGDAVERLLEEYKRQRAGRVGTGPS